VLVTGTLQRDAWEKKTPPPIELVHPGLWSIPVPMPDSPLRYVLAYALELPDGLVLVDAGWDSPASWDALQQGLVTIGGSVTDVEGVLVTHVHPDHAGLAGRVRDASGAWIGLHPIDAHLTERYASRDGLFEALGPVLDVYDVPDASRDPASVDEQSASYARLLPPDRLVNDEDELQLQGWDWRVVWTPGHSPGHVCLYSDDRRLLLAGDHVLARISPNISFHSHDDVDPLADYLASLTKVENLACDEILPGHQWRFSGLSDRVLQLREHHAARLDEVTRVLDNEPELSCWQVALRLTWSRPLDTSSPHIQRSASGETLAHLVYLERRGVVERSQDRVPRFRRVASH